MQALAIASPTLLGGAVLLPPSSAIASLSEVADASVVAGRVVDDLRVDLLVAAEHGQARALGRAGDLLADAQLAPRASFELWPLVHLHLEHLQLRRSRYRSSPLPPALPAFTELLAGVAHALALVGLRRPERTDARCGLAEHHLVVRSTGAGAAS